MTKHVKKKKTQKQMNSNKCMNAKYKNRWIPYTLYSGCVSYRQNSCFILPISKYYNISTHQKSMKTARITTITRVPQGHRLLYLEHLNHVIIRSRFKLHGIISTIMIDPTWIWIEFASLSVFLISIGGLNIWRMITHN